MRVPPRQSRGWAAPSPRPLVGGSVSDQQLTAIAKALTTDARIVVMDEPSATLTDHDLAAVFRVIRELTAGREIGHLHLAPSRRGQGDR